MARRSTSAGAGSAQLGIRGRLLVLLAVPLAGLLGITGYAMSTALRQSANASRLRATAEVSLASYRLIDALQAERKVLAAGQPTDARLRDDVVSASDELRRLADQQDAPLKERTTRALERVDAAGSLAATDTGGLVAVDGYSPAIASLLAVSTAGLDPAGAIDSGSATATDLLASAHEAAAKERDLVNALQTRDALTPAVFGQVSELAAAQDIQAMQAAAGSDPALAARIDRVGDAVAAASLGRDRLFLPDVEGASSDSAAVDAWLADATSRVATFHDLRGDAAAIAVAAVDGLAASSRNLALAAFAAFLAAALISTFLVRSAIRSIARPLQELATQAEDVALVRLPEAVNGQQTGSLDVHLPTIRAAGATEVREVAGAFNDVQHTALRLAGEQAVLRRNLAEALTNLGRRNQALLGRQLDFISSLEQRETDPAFLEHLFKLDHLASRMRRNAESLLILTGSETPRRRRKPAPLSEVVRAAMSEVEDFERVRLGHLGDATLTGPVVIDLVHMLAELIENALRFSPPDTTVEIEGRSLGQGGYQLAVVDHGVGMADVEIVAANQRLAGLDEVDGMPTRYLGQYVIAKLAAKTGALVRLQATAGGRGVTALVSLPESATVGGADRSSIARPLPGTLAARADVVEHIAPGAGLTPTVSQPETVIDPEADPFADEAPTREELVSGGHDGSEDWGWTPEVPSEVTDPGPVEDATFGDAPFEDAPFEDAPFEGAGVDLGDLIGAGSFIEAESHPVADTYDAPVIEPVVDSAGEVDADHAGLSFVGDVTFRHMGEEAETAAVPPPPPQDVPNQAAWSGLAQLVQPEAGLSQPAAGLLQPEAGFSQPEAGLSQPEAGFSQPEAGFSQPEAGPPGGGIGGGLARRVPGASLQESPLGQPVAEMPVPHERSADGVRSMLSAFQGGRSRGRGGDADEGSDPFQSSEQSDAGTYDRTGALRAPELEDHSDH